MKIILDTNFLIYSAKQKIDYVDNIGEIILNPKLVILSSVLDELKRLRKTGKNLKDRDFCDLALDILRHYINKKKIKVLETEGEDADKVIVDLTSKYHDLIVATADRELKRKLKGKARILNIRGKRKLELQ